MTETLNAFTPEHLIKILGKVPSAELSDALSIISADKIEKTLRVVSPDDIVNNFNVQIYRISDILQAQAISSENTIDGKASLILIPRDKLSFDVSYTEIMKFEIPLYTDTSSINEALGKRLIRRVRLN